MTTVVERAADLAAYVGKTLGASDWIALDQRKIDAFAEITGDDHWIHIDTERAKNELPDGKTLVHGFLTLAMIPFLQRSVFRVEKRGKGLTTAATASVSSAPCRWVHGFACTRASKRASRSTAGHA